MDHIDLDPDRYTVVWGENHASLNWFEAREYCEDLGADLVRLETREELNYVSNISIELYGHTYWVGLSDIDKEGKLMYFFFIRIFH